MHSLRRNNFIFEAASKTTREALLNPSRFPEFENITSAINAFQQAIEVWRLDHTTTRCSCECNSQLSDCWPSLPILHCLWWSGLVTPSTCIRNRGTMTWALQLLYRVVVTPYSQCRLNQYNSLEQNTKFGPFYKYSLYFFHCISFNLISKIRNKQKKIPKLMVKVYISYYFVFNK